MGLQSAMTTALTGLQAAETSIDVIGNNIANSNTVGFKGSEVVFATQFLQTQSIGSAPSDTNGGTNPRQIGLGVKVAQITPDFSQGTVEISSNPLDLAIQGDGFLVVQGGQGQPLYTRNGQLILNSLNQVTTSTGNKLLGYGVDDQYELQTASPQPIEIPLGGERVAQETTEAIFQGSLNPTVQAGDLPAVSSSETLGDSSAVYPAGTDTDPFNVDDARTVSPPSVATTAGAAFDTGVATGIGVGDYNYRAVLYNNLTGFESTPSLEFSATTTLATDRVDLSDLPDDSSGDWTHVRLYRTTAGGTDDFAYLDEIGIGTTTYSDDIADGSLGATLDESAIDSGSYTYYVTYHDPTSVEKETRPSQAIGSITLNDDSSSILLDFNDLVPPTDASYTQMRIYRNASGDNSEFYLVDTVDAPGTGGFINSYVDRTVSDDIVANETLDFDGLRAGNTTLLTDVQIRSGASTYKNVFQEGELRFTGEVGGASVTSQSLTIDATTNVQDLMDFMEQSLGLQDQSSVEGIDLPIGGGAISLSNGVLQVTSNFGEENTVGIPLTAFRLTPTDSAVPITVDINFSETQDATGPGTTTEFLVYDSLGSPLSVRLTTVLESADSNSTTYRWYASSGDSQPGDNNLSTVAGNGVMIFDSQGNLLSSPSDRISIFRELTASESPLEVDLDFSDVKSLAVTNASGEAVSTLNMISQDGFPPGVLTDFIITESGLIQGQFSNGTQRTLGQILMARFANNQGLEQVGDSLFSTSVNSGEPRIGNPGEDGLGNLTAGAVELSNTDVGQDLVEMILAQTQYQAGSRVIAAAQELLDELLSLQR